MSTKLIQCPKCGQNYQVYENAKTYFFCFDCQTPVSYNSDTNHPTEDPLRTASTNKLSAKKTGKTQLDIGKYLIPVATIIACIGAVVIISNALNKPVTQLTEASIYSLPKSLENKQSKLVGYEIFSQGSLSIYSGNCKCYKCVLLPGNKEQYVLFYEAFGKVVIDRSNKQFAFYFNQGIVVSSSYRYSMDNKEGKESFMLNDGRGTSGGDRYIAEKNFIIDIPPRKADGSDILGYQFEIHPYKTD